MELVCYYGETRYKIDQKKADVIVKIILDQENITLINCIKDEPKTIRQIVNNTKISTSTVYRKIRNLHKKNLLIISGNINVQGKREFRYQSKIRKVVTIFDEGIIDVKVYMNLKEGISK